MHRTEFKKQKNALINVSAGNLYILSLRHSIMYIYARSMSICRYYRFPNLKEYHL